MQLFLKFGREDYNSESYMVVCHDDELSIHEQVGIIMVQCTIKHCNY